jgi:hypothetical protein
MGRFYNGDINGKWWFAVQSSDTPERFGGQETSIDYIICNNEEFQEEMKKLETTLGENLKIFDEFFAKKDSYNNEQLVEFFQEKGKNYTDNISMVDIEYLLKDYADYQFGLEVAKYFEDTMEESCYISSEL